VKTNICNKIPQRPPRIAWQCTWISKPKSDLPEKAEKILSKFKSASSMHHLERYVWLPCNISQLCTTKQNETKIKEILTVSEFFSKNESQL
jgi:hypothetical protein